MRKNQIKIISLNIFPKKKSILLTVIILMLNVFIGNISAQQAYNLEVIFRKTNWNPDTIRCYGIFLSSAGDFNVDGYDDFVISVFFDNWNGYGYVFYGGNNVDTIPDIILKCEGEGQPLMSICSGDVNGDTISDVIIGQGQAGGWGKVFIYYGGTNIDSLPDFTLNGQSLNAWPFGYAVACGDINGDLYKDIIVGSYDNGNLHGRVYIFYGGTLLDTIPDVIINGQNNEEFGLSVGSGGDLNGDGYEDLVVGAAENREAYPGAGKVYVFFSGNPMDTIPDCWLHGEGVNDWLGWFNADIINNFTQSDQLITASRMWDGNSYGRGKVYILNGGNPMDTLPDFYMTGENDSSSLGNWCSSAGCIDGDSDAEALAGAPVDYGFLGSGYVWRGGSSMDTIPDAFLRGDSGLNQQIGWHVASAGDVNGDGRDEVMFSNYAVTGIAQSVWVCKYTGPGIGERNIGKNDPGFRVALSPNPFLNRTELNLYGLFKEEAGSIIVYDATGREVFYGELIKGAQKCQLNLKGWPAGVYFVKIQAGDRCSIHKVVKLK